MIQARSDVRVWVAAGHTDMRKGMMGLALLVQEGLRRDPHAGDLFIFRGRGGDLIKILRHDGLGVSLYAKRLDHGRFIWPAAKDGAVTITTSQMAYSPAVSAVVCPSLRKPPIRRTEAAYRRFGRAGCRGKAAP